MADYTNLALIRAKVGKSEELGQALSALVAPSRAEAECQSYDVYRSADDLDQWMVFENWRSQEGLKNHFDQSHMKHFAEQLPLLVDGDLDLRGFFQVPV